VANQEGSPFRRTATAAAIACLSAVLQGSVPAGSFVPRHPSSRPEIPVVQGVRVNADAKTMAEFEQRVQDYVSMHRKLEATLPDLPKDAAPDQITGHQIALAQLLRRARVHARPGDIFTKETRALFRRSLAGVMAGPGGRDLLALIMDENPGRIRLTINGPYPDSVPLAAVPPQVLQALPRLPDELEYRFVGDRLTLMDIHALLIVDIIENALPRI
jgi:hypothetical protein